MNTANKVNTRLIDPARKLKDIKNPLLKTGLNLWR